MSPPSLRVGPRRAPPRSGGCRRRPRGARPSDPGRRASSTTPPAATSALPPRLVATSIAVRLDLQGGRRSALAPDLVGEVHVRGDRRASCAARSPRRSACSRSSIPRDPRARSASGRATGTRGPSSRRSPSCSPSAIAFSAHSSPSSGRFAADGLMSDAIRPYVSTCSGPGESGSRSSSERSSAARMRSAPSELEVHVADETVGARRASRGAGGVELARGSFGDGRAPPRTPLRPVRSRPSFRSVRPCSSEPAGSSSRARR